MKENKANVFVKICTFLNMLPSVSQKHGWNGC